MLLIEKLKNYSLFLASGSPRRHQLLHDMGIRFEYLPTDVEEIYPPDLMPVEVAEYLSRLKLSTIDKTQYAANSIFIACDTIVVMGNEIIGKPADTPDAFRILRKLSGKEHKVISGLTVSSLRKEYTAHKITTVKFKELSEEEIEYYIHRFLPLDKAGAYGVQEWIGYIGIESVSGSFYNIMGLPTKLLWDLLSEITSL